MSASKLGVTAQLKKFSTTMKMLQHIASSRELLMTALSHLAAVERFLLESLDLKPDEFPGPPSTKPPPRPAEAPTTFNPKWDAAAFAKHVLNTYKDETTESGRENVRKLVERGVGAKLLTEEQATELLAKLK